MALQLFKKSELENQEGQPPGDQVVSNLKQIIRDAEQILSMVNESTILMGWIEDNLSSAKTLVNQVANAVKTDSKELKP